jgi:hypothetical protein
MLKTPVFGELAIGKERDERQIGSAAPRELIFYSLFELGQLVSVKSLNRVCSSEPFQAKEGCSAVWIVTPIRFIRKIEIGTDVSVHNNIREISILGRQLVQYSTVQSTVLENSNEAGDGNVTYGPTRMLFLLI